MQWIKIFKHLKKIKPLKNLSISRWMMIMSTRFYWETVKSNFSQKTLLLTLSDAPHSAKATWIDKSLFYCIVLGFLMNIFWENKKLLNDFANLIMLWIESKTKLKKSIRNLGTFWKWMKKLKAWKIGSIPSKRIKEFWIFLKI